MDAAYDITPPLASPLLAGWVTAPRDIPAQAAASFTHSPAPNGATEPGQFPAGEPAASNSAPLDIGASIPEGTGSAPASAPPHSPATLTLRQALEAQRRERLLTAYRALLAHGSKPDDAVARLRDEGEDVSRASLYRWGIAFDELGLAGLLDHRHRSGRRRSVMRLTDAEAARVRARVLATTNRTADSGSVPAALRQSSRRGELRPELVEEWAERDRDGVDLPDALRRSVSVPAAVVRQLRGPTDAALENLSAPGSMMWIDDARTGERRAVRVGDVIEADDATVNFYVCVPWELRGCPCSERWGVKVARFQWLVTIDRASRYVPGWSYTMRPRDSYRAEDIVSLFGGVFRQHGIWARACLERGAWESAIVDTMLDGLGVERLTAWSPHQKPFIEGLFNGLWTALSSMPGQIGRYRGEEEQADKVARSAQRGATDPRGMFPALADVIEGLRRVCGEHNRKPIHSDRYGTWVPEERWLAQQAEARAAGGLRALDPAVGWLFAPCVREWKVARGLVGGSVQIMEGLSLPFAFTATWLPNFNGARVRAHFDPSAPHGSATLVLLENHGDRQKGDVLGEVAQIDETASYARRVMGWANDPHDAGRVARLRNAAALRREVRTILPGGDTGLSLSDLRDGTGTALQIERGDRTEGTPAAPISAGPTRRQRIPDNPLAPMEPSEFAAASRRRAELLSATADD